MGLSSWTTVNGSVSGGTSSAHYFGGFKWIVTNSYADRQANNRSIITAKLFSGRTTGTTGAWNNYDNTSWIRLNENASNTFTTRYDFRNASPNVQYHVGENTNVFSKGTTMSYTINHGADRKATARIRGYLNGGVTSYGNLNVDSTITLPETPRIDPGTPGFSRIYLDENGNNPATTGKDTTKVRLTATSSNPDNFYTLAIEDITSGTTVLKSSKVKSLVHDINVGDSYYDKTWRYRARVFGGTNPSVDRSSATITAFVEMPYTPFYYRDGTTYKQVGRVWYREGGVYKKVKKIFYRNGGVWQ